jgi:GNAT superfamily N-acetyltransferase
MTEPLVLRRATLSDASATRELSKVAYAKWVPLIGREPIPMTANYERAVMEHIIDLYEDGGELLALVEMILKCDHLLIENIAVHPDRQGNGLGDRLLRHAEGVALILGVAEVRLYTNAAFISNLAFYAKRGYQEYRRGTMLAGSTTVFMRKDLPSTPYCEGGL